MTYFEIFLVYAVSWWLVLFMVLPHKADAPAQPGLGHVPSAPDNPMIKKKIIWTSVLTIIPTAVIYLFISNAHADTVYHAGGDCAPLETYHAPEDINAKDGFGAGGKQLKPATIGGSNMLGNMDKVNIGLDIPSAKYLEPQTQNPSPTPGHNADLSTSYIGLGKLTVGRDGSTTLNDQPIAAQPVYPEGCEHSTK